MYLLQRPYLKWNGRDRGVLRTPKRWIPNITKYDRLMFILIDQMQYNIKKIPIALVL